MDFSATYVFHDCFVVRTPSVVVLFDFWKRPDNWISKSPFVGSSPLTDEDMEKKIYVLVSHFHKDHYNKEIFSWGTLFPDITYVISRDVARHARHILTPGTLYSGFRPKPGSVKVLSEGESFSDGIITIDAFGSTDIGCSYAVVADGLSVFHAGDLNAWLWKDESTEEEVKSALDSFLSCIAPIVEKYNRFDLVMFPVDSRIGSDYQEGARIFLRKIKVERFLPMHFTLGETVEDLNRLRRDALDFGSYISDESPALYAGLTAPGDILAW